MNILILAFPVFVAIIWVLVGVPAYFVLSRDPAVDNSRALRMSVFWPWYLALSYYDDWKDKR